MKECIAMLLAGGQGSRLYALTQKLAKPAVPFGGKYRIIDFPLSNCVNSGIDTVGILTQYQPLELNEYIGNGQPWDLDRLYGGVHVLPPYQTATGSDWYKGTANAIYQNINFIERYQPEYVVILSGDHIYKQDYSKMLEFHKAKGAACTIAVMEVPMEEASRFGIMSTNVPLDVWDDKWKIYSRNSGMPGHQIGANAEIDNSMITEGCRVDGVIHNSVLFAGVKVGAGALIEDSILMPGAVIEPGAVVQYSIVAENVTVRSGAQVGCRPEDMADRSNWGVAVIGGGITVGYKAKVMPSAMVTKDVKDGEEQW